MIIGGFHRQAAGLAPVPVGAEVVHTDPLVWTLPLGGTPVLGCGPLRTPTWLVGDFLGRQPEHADLAAAFTGSADLRPGAWALVGCDPDRTRLLADLAHTVPLYWTRVRGGVVWANSARTLAALAGVDVDPQWLAVRLLAPALTGPLLPTRSAFTGIQLVPPGHRLDITEQQTALTRVWEPVPHDESWEAAARLLGAALRDGVAYRVAAATAPGSDLSGGVDSTLLTRLAAQTLAPMGRAIRAVTWQVAGTRHGGDLDYVDDAADHPGIDHHRLILDTGELPYSNPDTPDPAWAADEPAPATVLRAAVTRHLSVLRDAGSDLHLTGDGGDNLACAPLTHLADLVRSRKWRLLTADATGWARVYRCSAVPMLRSAYAAARTTPATALHAAADVLAGCSPIRGGWYSVAAAPAWATTGTRDAAVAAIRQAAVAADDGVPVDLGNTAAAAIVAEIGRTAAADAEVAFTIAGIRVANPFLDSAVVAAALTLPGWCRTRPDVFKALLHEALPGVAPPRVAARRGKGETTADHVRGLRRNLPGLLNLVDGHLAERGLLDLDQLRPMMTHAAAGLPLGGDPVEPVVVVESWLRALDRAAPVTWTVYDAGAPVPGERT